MRPVLTRPRLATILLFFAAVVAAPITGLAKYHCECCHSKS